MSSAYFLFSLRIWALFFLIFEADAFLNFVFCSPNRSVDLLVLAQNNHHCESQDSKRHSSDSMCPWSSSASGIWNISKMHPSHTPDISLSTPSQKSSDAPSEDPSYHHRAWCSCLCPSGALHQDIGCKKHVSLRRHTHQEHLPPFSFEPRWVECCCVRTGLLGRNNW